VLGAPPRSRESRDERHARRIEQLAQTPGFKRLRDEIIALAELAESQRVLDIGAGTGLLTLAAAPRVAHVTAVDLSPGVCRRLEARASELELANVSVAIADARDLPLPSRSIDLALSNYCLHHLNDSDKRVALDEIARVLRPGGELVLGDMMFNLGLRTARDRRVGARIAFAMIRRGPLGLLRLLRNILKTLLAPSEWPASVDWWDRALRDSGFCDVQVVALEHEGGIARARRADDARSARADSLSAPPPLSQPLTAGVAAAWAVVHPIGVEPVIDFGVDPPDDAGHERDDSVSEAVPTQFLAEIDHHLSPRTYARRVSKAFRASSHRSRYSISGEQ
jgi:SAM-dependent methyltransferase